MSTRPSKKRFENIGRLKKASGSPAICFFITVLITFWIFSVQNVLAESPSSSRFIQPEKLRTIESSEDSISNASLMSQSPKEISPLVSVDEQREIDQIIERGKQIYQEQNWSAFRQHFEHASRLYPNNVIIQHAYIKARCSIELANRYKDSSFFELVQNSTESSITGLFDEVFTNVQTWHVDTPDWHSLLEHGMDGLEIAFTTPIFLERYNIDSQTAHVLVTYCSILKDFNQRNRIHSCDELRNRIFEIADQISNRTSIPKNAVALEFICSMTCSLDPWSSFLTPGQISDLYSMIDGHFVGLGIELKPDVHSLLIIRVIPKSPADLAGLHSGEKILSINGTLIENPKDNDKTNSLLQGREGSVAELQVLNPDNSIRHVNVIRKRVEVPSVEQVQILPEDSLKERIGYLKISCFQKTTVTELTNALKELDRLGMQCLIIDLRQNPGGLLREAIDICDMFIDNGTIVKTRGRSGERPYYATNGQSWRVPLVILIDSNSASASEIFAGAMHENGRARIVGTRSYGKGTVQALLRLKGVSTQYAKVSGLRLTTEKFYSPKGNPYSGIGVEPDVLVNAKPSDIKVENNSAIFKNVSQSNSDNSLLPNTGKIVNDPCLSRALAEARQMLLSSRPVSDGTYSSDRR